MWKGVISGVCMPNMIEVSFSYGSKVIAKIKIDNRQTDRQTNRQDKNSMPTIIRSGGGGGAQSFGLGA